MARDSHTIFAGQAVANTAGAHFIVAGALGFGRIGLLFDAAHVEGGERLGADLFIRASAVGQAQDRQRAYRNGASIHRDAGRQVAVVVKAIGTLHKPQMTLRRHFKQTSKYPNRSSLEKEL